MFSPLAPRPLRRSAVGAALALVVIAGCHPTWRPLPRVVQAVRAIRSANVSEQQEKAWLFDRIVLLRGEIDGDVATTIIAKMMFLESRSHNAPIDLIIDSDGGSLVPTLAIVREIGRSGVPVRTHCAKRAGGLAALVLSSGVNGIRSTTTDCEIRLAIPQVARPPATPAEQEQFDHLLRDTLALFAAATGQSEERIEKDLRANRHFDASEAVAYHLADRIWRP